MILHSKPNEREESSSELSPTLILRILMIGVLVWGSFHAIGVTIYSPELDWRKPTLVYGCVIVFLGFWNLMIWIRNRRDSG